MSKHIVVLGSNSFSGAHYIRHALQAGFGVTGVSRSPEAHPLFLPYLSEAGEHPHGFTFVQADLNHDLPKIYALFDELQPQFVVNFAAQGMVAESWLHPEQWMHTNIVGPLQLINYLRTCPWLEKFVQISTPEVYGSTVGVVPESMCYAPSTPYAVSKAAADMNLMCFFKAYDFPVVFTRAANVYGPCQQLYRIIPRAVLRFMTGGTLDLHGGGHSMRSFIHIDDVARATLDIMQQGHPGEVFHISTRSTLSIRDLVLLVATRLGVNPEKHIRIVGERRGKDEAYLLDSSKVRGTFGWQESYMLEKGIDTVIDWAKAHVDDLLRLPQEYQHKA